MMTRLLFVLSLITTGAAWSDEYTDCPGFRVALDIGHTLRDPGAISARGRTEFSFNATLAREVRAGLAVAGIEAFPINEDGTIESLEQRTMAAKRERAALFLSIHHDSVQPRYLSEWTVDGHTHRYSDHFRGFSLFVSERNTAYHESLHFATLLGRQLLARGLTPTLHHAEPIPGENRPLLNDELGIYRFDDLVVLRTATVPAVLFEAGVIVHRDEELDLSDPAYRARHVRAVVAAVGDYCRWIESADDSLATPAGPDSGALLPPSRPDDR